MTTNVDCHELSAGELETIVGGAALMRASPTRSWLRAFPARILRSRSIAFWRTKRSPLRHTRRSCAKIMRATCKV